MCNIYFSLNIILLLIILTDIYSETSTKHIEYPFTRNLTINTNMTPNNIFKNLFYNLIYIKLKVGSNKSEIPFYLYLQQYSTIIQSSNINFSQVKGLYNETSSNTYIKLKNAEKFPISDMEEGILSKDNFYFSESTYPINFYLSKLSFYNTHITEGGIIGFKLYSLISEDKYETSFIKNLKQLKLISNYIFSFKYSNNNLNDNDGKLIIGEYPHNFDTKNYKKINFINAQADITQKEIEWYFKLDGINVNEKNIEQRGYAYFYPEIGFIVGSQYYFYYIKSLDTFKNFFIEKKNCFIETININDYEGNDIEMKLNGEFIIYYCDKNVDNSQLKFGNISFVKKSMEYDFNFDSENLWIEHGNYKYYMIIEKSIGDGYWYFGKPFFKKYQIFFDYDNKQIGLYTKIEPSLENNDNNNLITALIIVIIIFIVIVTVSLFIIIKFKICKNRKFRANELKDDDYDYSIQNESSNK